MSMHCTQNKRIGFVLFFLLAFPFFSCKVEYAYQPCSRDRDCEEGYICRGGRCEKHALTCKNNTDCIGGRVCVASTCRHLSCRTNQDCAATEICRRGKCLLYKEERTVQTDASSTEKRPKERNETVPESKPKTFAAFCSPNGDGKITLSELLPKVGTSFSYLDISASPKPVTVNLVGSMVGGNKVWDFSQLVGKIKTMTETQEPLKELWFAKEFPTASYVSVLDSLGTLFGVYRRTNDALLLQGVASKKKGETMLKYDRPITQLRFPLQVGSRWTTSGTSSGIARGVSFFKMNETYVFEIDAKGLVKTVAGSFPVLRLKLYLIQQQSSPSSLRRTAFAYFFLSECYGVVARVDSLVDESNPLFSQASQVRLLTGF